jgi:hypothetical protein
VPDVWVLKYVARHTKISEILFEIQSGWRPSRAFSRSFFNQRGTTGKSFLLGRRRSPESCIRLSLNPAKHSQTPIVLSAFELALRKTWALEENAEILITTEQELKWPEHLALIRNLKLRLGWPVMTVFDLLYLCPSCLLQNSQLTISLAATLDQTSRCNA